MRVRSILQGPRIRPYVVSARRGGTTLRTSPTRPWAGTSRSERGNPQAMPSHGSGSRLHAGARRVGCRCKLRCVDRGTRRNRGVERVIGNGVRSHHRISHEPPLHQPPSIRFADDPSLDGPLHILPMIRRSKNNFISYCQFTHEVTPPQQHSALSREVETLFS